MKAPISRARSGDSRQRLWGAVAGVVLAVAGGAAWPAEAQQPLSGAERAGVVLTTAKGAFNDGNYETAAERFREYLKAGVGGRAEVAAARYGLGVCLIEGPAKDYKTAADMLQYAVATPAFKERAHALYYLGAAQKQLAAGAVVPAPGVKGPEVRARRQADQNLAQAAANFGLAAEAFAQGAPAGVEEGKALPAEWEWVAKARCEQADALLRAGQFKAAAGAAAAVTEDARLRRSRYAPQAIYARGYASFAEKDYATAVRSLATLTPFEPHGEIGLHARYLLARTHHLTGERPEAVAGYREVVAAWERRRNDARARAAAPDVAAAEKARLTALAEGPAPDYVARAAFYWGVVLAEFGQADDAATRFLAAVKLGPESAVAAEARLRAAEAAVAVKRYAEAIEVVSPLVEDERHGDQALRWLAKGQYGVGTTPIARGRGLTAQLNAQPDPQLVAEGVRKAIETLRKADERAKAADDGGAAGRRGVILLELGDMLQLDRQYAEAAEAYRAAGAAAPKDPAVGERSLERQAAALQLAGRYEESDRACMTFAQRFPKSELRAEVELRHAENALLAGHAKRDAAADAKSADAKSGDAAKGVYGEALARFGRVVERHPETTQAHLARLGTAQVHYLEGRFDEAGRWLAKIPEGERGAEELVGVGLLQADCELRAIPETAEDALSGARVVAQLERVTTRLEAFVAARPGSAVAAEAWVRVGYASQRLGDLLADPAEKRRALAKARRAYATVVQQFAEHPLYPVAVLEHGKVLARFGGGAAAVMELSKFTAAPLDASPVAPLALIHLADAQRGRRQPAEAARVLADVRERHEAAWLADPKRREWAVALRYGLGLAHKEAGKFAEAKEAFAKLAAEFPDRPEAAEAAWRVAQCDTDAALAEVEGQRRALALAVKPGTQEEVLAALVEATKRLRGAAERMGREAEKAAAKGDESDLPQRMNLDAAWCWKAVGEVEVEVARRAAQAEAARKAAERLAAGGMEAGAVRPGEVSVSAIAVQPGEMAARETFRLVVDGGDPVLADEARLELVELHAQRDEHDAAIELVRAALGREPGADLSERLKIRLATLLLDKGDTKGAAEAAREVLGQERGGYGAFARALAVEAAYRLKDYEGVVELAKPFAENARGPGRQPGTADHALLRMADAQGRLGRWREAREAVEVMLARFPSGGLTADARFTQGWVMENLGEADRAAEAYGLVAARTGGELGARANLQVGRIRLAQGRVADAVGPLLAVGYGYDDPELCPAALCDAARAMAKLGRGAEARRVLERVVKDYPAGKWAGEAKAIMREVK